MNSPLDQQIEWLGLRARVPDDWQIVRHGLRPAAGRLVFVDRRRERFTLAWTRCATQPDLERVVSDYRSLLAEEHAGAELRPLGASDRWRGIEAVSAAGEGIVTRAASWDPDGRRLLEAVALTQGEAEAERTLPHQVLAAVEAKESGEVARRFRAFDIDVEAPPGLRLVAVEAKPADVRLTFHDGEAPAARGARRAGELGWPRRSGAEATLRRLGMADSWYDGDLRRLLERQEPGARFDTHRNLTRTTGDALLAAGCERGPRWLRALGWLRAQRTLAWACPAENAVYLLSTRSPRRSPQLPTDFTVRCREGAS